MNNLFKSQALFSFQELTVLRFLFLTLFGSFVIALSSQVTLPLFPVPVTLQTGAVLFLSMVFGWRLSFSMVSAYLLEGVVGLPVFAGLSAGVGVLVGPTGGYLFGFLLAAVIGGYLSESGKLGKNFLTVLAISIISLLPIFGLGISVLAVYTGWSKVLALGLYPFLLGETLKIVFLLMVVPYCWSRKSQQK